VVVAAAAGARPRRPLPLSLTPGTARGLLRAVSGPADSAAALAARHLRVRGR